MLLSLFTRDRLDVNIVADRNPLYTRLSDGGLRNGYQLKVLNMRQEPLSFRIEMQGLPEGSFQGDGITMVSPREATINVEADKLKNVKIYVTMPPNTVKTEANDFAFKVTEVGLAGDGESIVTGTLFHGPKK
ncbi:MAG TPA: FixG Ig-like domain-containing protein, partial [Aestuariivirga sp.]|nr:FixG Ig-like domain-containing protein [Aestuariivirga sp.]